MTRDYFLINLLKTTRINLESVSAAAAISFEIPMAKLFRIVYAFWPDWF